MQDIERKLYKKVIKMNEISNNDLRKFFASYWLLHSALYDFAQGLNNQRNRRFTWAITNYYYSMVFIGRLFMFLHKNLYFEGHADLANFFRGNRVPSRGNTGAKAIKLKEDGDFQKIRVLGNPGEESSINNINEFVNISHVAECIGWYEEKIKKFGDILHNLKNFRNENTYEAFIIYAQENHSVLTDFIMTATDSVRDIVESYLKEACKLFFNYWRNKSAEIIKLLGHVWLLPTTLNILKKHNLPYQEIENIINRGFFFENPEVYSPIRDIIDIKKIIEEVTWDNWSANNTIPKDLKERFESVCNIEEFGGKKKIANEAFRIFKNLINLREGEIE